MCISNKNENKRQKKMIDCAYVEDCCGVYKNPVATQTHTQKRFFF